MVEPKEGWFNSPAFARAAVVLGVVEMLGGLALIVFKHDGAQGHALLAIGAGTFGGVGAITTRRS